MENRDEMEIIEQAEAQDGSAALEADEAPAPESAECPAVLALEHSGPQSDEDEGTHDVDAIDIVKLGRQGEHMTQTVKIDASAWLAQLPGCQLIIAAIRRGESAIYLPEISTNAGLITWPITSADTAKAGWGRAEVRAMLGEKIKKSAIFRTYVEASLEDSGEETPPSAPDWVQTIMASVEAARSAAEAAERQAQAAAEQATAAGEQAKAAAEQATAATAKAQEAAKNTEGLRGWGLTLNADNSVTLDYSKEEVSL